MVNKIHKIKTNSWWLCGWMSPLQMRYDVGGGDVNCMRCIALPCKPRTVPQIKTEIIVANEHFKITNWSYNMDLCMP